MDELELLKRQWHRQESDLPHISYEDIYKMILKKSSSIVKWIFLISIGEIILWSCLALLVSDSDQKFIQDIGLGNIMLVANILYYLVVVSFIILFYRNYKKISTTDSVKDLMQNILRTRKTVKYFIIFNIAGAGIMILGINIFYYFNQDLMFQLMIENQGISPTMSKEKFFDMFFIIQLVLGVLIISAVFVFYRLVYGILLRRLNKNYKELKKIEV